MDKTLAIFKKEIKGFLMSPSFYMICFLCSAIFSWTYPIQLNLFAQSLQNSVFQPGIPQQQLNIHFGLFLRHLYYLNLILIFIVPAITMRLFSEEKKMRTYDLLLTSPVTSFQIVFGKFLAACCAVFVLVFLSFLYPVMTVFFTKINWAPLIIAFVGIFLVACVYVAMNLFCSALTESAIVAYVMAFMFNIAIWFVGIGVEVVDKPWARQIFEHISLNQHLAGMVEGTIRTSSIVFFLSVMFLFCFLSERVVESSRWR